MMKRAVTIQDISCIGKCSLTVALPVLSAMGVEAAILPTAVLSTHTMFQNPVFIDLTDQLTPIAEHWKAEGFTFDSIYTGYLGSRQQIGLVSSFISSFHREGCPVIIDPVMADNGKLYPGFDLDFVQEMRGLCRQADILLPNLTEASLLADIPYQENPDLNTLKNLLRRLADLGPKYVVLTGFSPSPEQIGVIGFDSTTGRFFDYVTERIPASYHGTGDIFASTVTGAVMNGESLEEALRIACDYVRETIRVTVENPHSRTYGVDFETTIPWLLHRMGKMS